MTLQQKMLAKQSKKGFTLVELVVVIAILGILAAIAIPSVVGIINNAQNSTKEANATELSSACKTLYSEVASGQLNQKTPSDELNALSTANLPAANATVSTCKDKAGKLTVQDAIDYQGLKSKFDSSNISDYVYVKKDGAIYFKDSYTGTSDGTLTLATKLSDLRNS